MSALEYHRLIIAALLAAIRVAGAFMICPALGDSKFDCDRFKGA